MKLSKNILVLLVLTFVTVTIQSCSKNAEPRFFVDVERDFEVPSSLGAIVTHFFELKNVPTKLDQNLDLFGLAKDKITSINPGDATLTTVSGLMDWSLVSSVEVYALSRNDPNNKVQIFYSRSRDTNAQNGLQLFNTFADISEIMVDETIDLEVRLTTIVAVPGNFRARILFNYAVFDEL